ncbi:MAG: DNA mismatch repair endonuclease MutL, partial [Oscillospiraceae bacterium]
MAIINVLDKQTAELIAAGEVVEKPASVVKELVENSIDAGARNIIVDIENGGIRKILVQDDGCGIDSEYVKTAFIRHATSKISTGADLDHIHSLGFRGEALASIASVSRLTLITKTHEQDFGVEIAMSGGDEDDFCVKPFVDGSRFIIKDLFYNTPARMKFLKKDGTEAGYIQDILTNLSLSKPEISFTFKKDNKEIFSTIGDGDLKNTMAGLFGTSFVNEITPVNYSDVKYKINGYITLAHCSRQSRNMQFAFINGRYVKNKTIIAAVENAYKGSTMVGKFPGYVINIQMPFEIVDVNVHPAKTEVRFANDGEIFSTVYRAVKLALSASDELKQFTFATKQAQSLFKENEETSQQSLGDTLIQANCESSSQAAENVSLKINIIPPKAENQRFSERDFNLQYASESILNSDRNITPYMSQSDFNKSLPQTEQTCDDGTQPPIDTPPDKSDILIENSAIKPSEQDRSIRVIGEVFSTYILCESGENLIMIDKHAAHERLIYERLKRYQSCDNQMLLSPINVKL